MKTMTMLALTMTLTVLCGCGWSSVSNDLIAQPKRIIHNTPIVCPNYRSVDVSLGVMQNGVGSMSTHDEVLVVEDGRVADAIESAIQQGKLMRLKYDEARFRWCTEEMFVTEATLVP